MEELREAILRALQEGDLLPPELMEQMLQNPDLSQNQELRDIVNQIIQRMEERRIHFTSGSTRASDAASLANSRRPSGRGATEHGSAL